MEFFLRLFPAPWLVLIAGLLAGGPLYAGDSIVVFNEVMYHPAGNAPDGEWIELYNQNGLNVDLSGWQITGGVNYRFPSGTVLAGGAQIVVAKSPATVGFGGALGPWTGSLSNSGDTIQLKNNSGRVMDELAYNDKGDWPIAPDGSGVSLAKRDPNAASSVPGSWVASAQVGGTPGTANFPAVPAPITRQVIALESNWKYLTDGSSPAANWTTLAFDDSTWASGSAGFQFGGAIVYTDPPPPSGNDAFEIVPWTGDGDCGVSSTKSYTHKIICNRPAPGPVIDGVTFDAPGTGVRSGTNWSLTGATQAFGNNPSDLFPVDSFSYGLVRGFYYGTTGAPSHLALTGLTPDRDYLTTFYVTGYGSAGGRRVLVTPSTGTGLEIDENARGNGGGQLIRCRYRAPASGSITFDFTPVASATWNLYAFSNEVSSPGTAPVPIPLRTKIDTLHNTGVNSTGAVASAGQPDGAYVDVTTTQPAVVEAPNSAWLSSDGSAQWIGPTGSGYDAAPAKTYTYRTTFDLSHWKKEGAAISVRGAADNSLDAVRINGIPIAGLVIPGFDRLYGPFTVPTSSLLPGLNTVEVDWTNSGTDPNPGGLLVEWEGQADAVFGRTALPANPVTSYFRQKFTVTGNPLSSYRMQLNEVVDDGAIFSLNGQEIFRVNMPAGPVTSTTRALTDVVYPEFKGAVEVPASALVVGENVLTCELHQSAQDLTDAVFGATLSVTETPPVGGGSTLLLNEIAAVNVGAGEFFVEVRNPGSGSLALSGYRVRTSSGAEAALSGTLAPGALLAVTEATLGFRPLDGEKLFLVTPGGFAVADAAVLKTHPQARDSTGRWLTPQGPTPGAANTFSLSKDVVINEIMYHHHPQFLATGTVDNPEEWIELYNQSSAVVDLSGWKLQGGISFDFPQHTLLGPGGYLVISNNAAALRTKYPAITIAGDFSGKLSNSEDVIRLEDLNGNPVNEVHYYHGGRWDDRADGGGSSLELRNPGMDNSQPEAWTASDESGKATWLPITYSGSGAPPSGSNDPTRWNEFILGLLNGGQCLVDDVSVKQSGATELIQNGTFSDGTSSKWRLLGNHGGHGRSIVVSDPDAPGNKVLKIVATGATEHMHNHCETTLKNGSAFVALSSAANYTISFRARWVSGCPRLQSRLYFNRLARQFLLPIPELTGTPGAPNSCLTAAVGPTYTNFGQAPVLPAAAQPIVVHVTAQDPDGVAQVTLKWRRDGSAAYTSVAMALTSTDNYEGFIPGQTAGSILQFYVEGQDNLGAVSTFPAAGPNARALIKVKDSVAPPGPAYGLRTVMLLADANKMHDPPNAMSDDPNPCTIIYRESEVFYDAAIRLKSSERGRTGDSRLGFALFFDPMHKFRGVNESVNLDRSSWGRGTDGSGTGQTEMMNWMFFNRAGGIPSMYNDMVYFIAPRTIHTGSAQLTMAEFNDNYLTGQYENGGSGPSFKYELIYYPTSTNDNTPEGLKVPQPDDVLGVTIAGINTPQDKESYRWNFILGNAGGNDDYSRIIAFNQTMRLSGTAFATAIPNAIDIDQWLRTSAAVSLVGADDHYSTAQGAWHNLKLYARPSDGRILYLPWDMDFMTIAATNPAVGNPDLAKIIAANPLYERIFYGHLHDIISTSFNPGYMTSWATHYQSFATTTGNWQDVVTYAGQRGTYLESQLLTKYPKVAFSITTNGGADFSAAGSSTILAGLGWIDVREIQVRGAAVALPVTWTGKSTWQVVLPVSAGAHLITLDAIDYQGHVVSTTTITITGTGPVLPASRDNLVISELNYHPAAPTAAEVSLGYSDADDFEFVELKNISTTTISLAGCRFLGGLDYAVPSGTMLGPGGYAVIPRRAAAFAVRHSGVATLPEYFNASGNVLANSGEEIALLDASGTDIERFSYHDSAPWPEAADGLGPSLVLIAPQTNPDPADPLNWRASFAADGNPGTSDAAAPLAAPFDDDNENGIVNVLEQTLPEGLSMEFVHGPFLQLVRRLDADVHLSIEMSADLENWEPGVVDSIERVPGSGGTERLRFLLNPLTQPGPFFRARLQP